MPNLQIKEVERFVLDVPFTPRTAPWNRLLVRQYRVVEVLRVTTDSPGLVGYGETLPHYTWGNTSEEARRKVIGRNPADLLGDDTLGASLQMALYDLVGKALEVPLHRLLGLPQVRAWCPIAWWNTKMPPEVLAAEAQDAVRQGYLAHKMKARPWFDIFDQVEAISATTPPGYRIDIDWNDMLLNAGNATPVLQELGRNEKVALFEGPIPQRDTEGYRLLRKKTNRPIAIHFDLPPFPVVVRAEMCDGFVVFGSISDVLRQGTLAGAFEKPFFLQLTGTGLTTALMAHLGAVLPFAQYPGVTAMNIYEDDLLTEPLTMLNGCVRVPDAPGLGVTVDEEALSRYRMEPPYSIPPERLIISVQWADGRTMRYAGMHYEAPEGAVAPFSHLQHAAPHYSQQTNRCWEDFLAGNQPVAERGVTMQVWDDDGSKEWAELYARCLNGPVRQG